MVQEMKQRWHGLAVHGEAVAVGVVAGGDIAHHKQHADQQQLQRRSKQFVASVKPQTSPDTQWHYAPGSASAYAAVW